MGGNFVDLGVSFVDEDFTLDPFPYIEDGRDEVLGLCVGLSSRLQPYRLATCILGV